MAEKPALSARVDAELKDALERAAKDDDRSTSSLLVKIVREWLTARGYLSAEAPAGGRSRGGKRRAAQ